MGRRIGLACVALALLGPATAGAQVFVSPQAGLNLWGDTIEPPGATFGGSLGVMHRRVGVEVDYAFAPDFFPEGHPDGALHAIGDLDTLMVNAVYGTAASDSLGGPYVSGGLGWVRVLADDPSGVLPVRGTDWGVNVGGGVMGFFTDRTGIRADFRYFRDLREHESEATEQHGPHYQGDVPHVARTSFRGFGFWRATVGIAFRF